MSGITDDDLFDSVANYLMVTSDNFPIGRVGLLNKTTWYPGFTRKLGSKGRYELLRLIRNKCNTDERCKFIFRNHDPPISAGKLSFYRVEFLWKIAHLIGVFDEALHMYNIYIKKSVHNRRIDSISNRRVYNIKDLEMQVKNSHRIISNITPGNLSRFETEIIDQLNRFYSIIKMKLSLSASDRGGWYSLFHSLNKIQIPSLCNIKGQANEVSNKNIKLSNQYAKTQLSQ